MPGHAEAEHEQIAEPEGEPREKADLGDVDGVEAEIRIDPKSYRAAGEDGGADIVADRVAGETRERCNAVRHVFLADGPQREEVIEGQGAERADHAQRRERDVVGRYFRQRGQDHPGIDAMEGADQGRDRKADDEEARRDSEPFPADPSLEATPKRGQQSVHSSSRQGGNKLKALPTRLMGKRRPIAPHVKTHRAKTFRCAVLDNASFGPRATPLSHALHMPQRGRFEPCRFTVLAVEIPLFRK